MEAETGRLSLTLRTASLAYGPPQPLGILTTLTLQLSSLTRSEDVIYSRILSIAFEDSAAARGGVTFEFTAECGNNLVLRRVRAADDNPIGVWVHG